MHLYMIVHVCIFMTDLPQQISEGAIIGIYSFLSASFLTATKECVEHPHVQAPNQCESRRVKNWGKQRQCGGRKRRALRVSEHVRVGKRGRGKQERNKRELEMRQQG